MSERLPKIIAFWLLCGVLGLICVILAPYAYHARESATAFKDALVHMDGAMGEIRLAAKASVTASRDTDAAIQHVDQTMTKVDGVVDGTNVLIFKAGKTVDGVNSAVSSTRYDLDTMAGKIDTAIDAYATIPAHFNGVSDAIPPTLYALQGLTSDIRKFVDDPETAATRDSLNALFLNSATIVKHTDDWLFPPKYTGKHPFWHGVGKTGEYVLKVAPGVAGGIAIAKGN